MLRVGSIERRTVVLLDSEPNTKFISKKCWTLVADHFALQELLLYWLMATPV